MYILYITNPSKEEALKISHILLDEGLIACANIFDNITSVYKWENEIKEDTEVILITKTSDSNVDKIKDRVKDLHSYECPCIAAIRVDDCNADFLKWVEGRCGA